MKKKKKAIPSKPPAQKSRALSDDELKKVAGGDNSLADEIAGDIGPIRDPKRK